MLSPLSVDAKNLSRSSLFALLTEFLSANQRPAYTMNFQQLDGYLRALAGGPQQLAVADWLPLVFNHELPNYESREQENWITNVLICLYTWHRQQVLQNRCDLAFAHVYSESKACRLDAEQWARGFLQGYIVLQDIWDQFLAEQQTSSKLAVILPISVHDEIDAILAAVSCVADADFALAGGTDLAQIRENFNRLPPIIIQYGLLGQLRTSPG